MEKSKQNKLEQYQAALDALIEIEDFINSSGKYHKAINDLRDDMSRITKESF